MITTLCILASVAPAGAHPFLFKEQISCADIALAANAYIALGQKRAVQEMRRFVEPPLKPRRLGILCQIIFEPKRTHAPLRARVLGANSILESMDLRAWPQLPLVMQRDVWFLLAESYLLRGAPEPISSYMNYCEKNGTFRKKPLMVPSRYEAFRALEELCESNRWRAVKWSRVGTGDGSWASEIKDVLTRQASACPASN
jgi:hypothetical protein